MFTYLKLAGIAVLLAVLGYTHFLAYNRGKDSVIQNVLAGVATTAKQQDKVVTETVIQTVTDTKQLAKLAREKDDLKKKLEELVNSNPRPECVMSTDELHELQDAARQTQP